MSKFVPGKGWSLEGYGDGELNVINGEGKINSDLIDSFIPTIVNYDDDLFVSQTEEDYFKKLPSGFYILNNKDGDLNLFIVLNEQYFKLK